MKAMQGRQLWNIGRSSASTARSWSKEIWMVEGFHSLYAIPLLSKGEPKGVMEVFSRSEDKAIAKDRVSFLETLRSGGNRC